MRSILKPCPFCGEKEDISIRIKEYNGKCDEIIGYIFSYIECLPCGGRTCLCFEADAHILGYLSAKHMAIEKWNRRFGLF